MAAADCGDSVSDGHSAKWCGMSCVGWRGVRWGGVGLGWVGWVGWHEVVWYGVAWRGPRGVEA